MLSIEQKRQIFIKLREENYQASLRLEGFAVSPIGDRCGPARHCRRWTVRGGKLRRAVFAMQPGEMTPDGIGIEYNDCNQ